MKTRAILISLSVSILSLIFVLNCGDKEKPKEEAAPAAASALSPELEQGKEIFVQNCASCHGEKGAGDGVASASLNPKPRNYKAPANEWKNGPTEAGVLKTLNNGIPGNPQLMVAFKYLGEEKLKLVAKYVVYLNQN
ncbi:cytochrome c [Leptospira langatensis]|uniref:Cytochrome c n=1 Tax=Leptospira langatensis TaxID=2484983 RepID=A0A5F1ZT78_9LEPT|nr:cytochrome c [Leptospira langatensis]TGK02750.1 cytochrome c [Leptospira langatensis]TGL40046.1 cytochrome c [Leptospira langatensis]